MQIILKCSEVIETLLPLSELNNVFEKLLVRYKGADLLNPQKTEQVLETDFNEREHELLYSNIILTKLPMPYQVKHRVFQALQRLRTKRRLARSQRSYATSDTVRFCKVFYRTPLGMCNHTLHVF